MPPVRAPSLPATGPALGRLLRVHTLPAERKPPFFFMKQRNPDLPQRFQGGIAVDNL